ncbi:MAG: PQQ-dependent sugar dehydrogenase [Candidatus Sumerlaeia bacterium]|nr:PQQ-dependent sugar dehydrogenase [Candidatus Sumerlaeia bacterium]
MVSFRRCLRSVAALAAATGIPAASAEVADLRITEVRPETDQVEVTNTSRLGFTTVSNLPFSHSLNEATFIAGGTSFASGESRVFTVPGLNDTGSDLWLYSDGNFTSPGSIVSGLKYGAGTVFGREAIAVAAGIWPSDSAFVPAGVSPESLRAVAYDTTDPASWAAGGATLGAFFGTGTVITAPHPDIPLGTVSIELEVVASGLVAPIGLEEPDDGTGRLFIYDQAGFIWVVESGALLPTPLLDVSARLVTLGVAGPGTFDERGLIGFALHPDFTSNRRFYTFTSEPVSGTADFTNTSPTQNCQTVIAEWQTQPGNPNLADLGSRREILRIDKQQFNHNGGTMRFGPDGMLYIAIGDGGGADDSNDGTQFGNPIRGHDYPGNGQDTGTIYGNILRIDVDGSDGVNGQYGIPAGNPFVGGQGLDEIWVYGLRNPFLFSFDSLTGDLYIGDVGQNQIEEVHIAGAGDNCGWRHMEGSFFFDPNGTSPGRLVSIPIEPIPPDLLAPVAEYDHGDGISIMGGFVYRGTAIPALDGLYVTGDFTRSFATPSGRLFHLDGANEFHELRIGDPERPFGLFLKGFGEDRSGEIYACGSTDIGPFGTSGVVLRLVPLPTTAARQALIYF